MSDATDANELINQFRSDFGIKKPDRSDLHETQPVEINGRKWRFTLRSCESEPDVRWTSLHSKVYMPGEDGDALAAQMATNITLRSATVALSVAAINGTPTYALMDVDIGDKALEQIRDPYYPPREVRYKAAEKMLLLLRSDNIDSGVVIWLKEEYDEHVVQKGPRFPDEPQRAVSWDFKCEDCHFVLSVPDERIIRLEEPLENKGYIVCPACSGKAFPPERYMEEDGPLANRLGGS